MGFGCPIALEDSRLKDRRLSFATLLACFPTLFDLAGIAMFTVSIMVMANCYRSITCISILCYLRHALKSAERERTASRPRLAARPNAQAASSS